MKKVIIIGCPGSGKSTFARKLKEKTKLPLYHLDNMFWNEDKTNVEREVFISRLQKVLEKPCWIIDGNYESTMEMRMKECDSIFFLDYPAEVCVRGIEERKGKVRSDMPWVEDKEEDKEFISYVRNFNTVNKPVILKLLHKYSLKNIYTFNSRDDAKKWILTL